jgi:Family of unknown function (DUF6790)
MYYLIFPGLALLFTVGHLVLNGPGRRSVVEVTLGYFLFFAVGLEGVFGFYGHAFMGVEIAKSIGWSQSPFQYEVAIANLAFGVLGLLCIWLREGFWVATTIGNSVWLWGDAVGHIREIIVNHDYAPNNAGAALYSDLILPAALVALTIAYVVKRRSVQSR